MTDTRRGPKRKFYLLFDRMEIGTFFFTTASPTTISKYGTGYRKENGLTHKDFYYTCRPAEIGGVKGYKVWRLE